MIQRFRGHSPIIHPAARLAANATLVGCVTVEAASSIWYGAVLRGDESSIHVGAGSNIQDNAVLHCDADCPTVIGRDVTVGHGAILHSCTVEDTCLIGMGAIILNGVSIGKNCIIGAGALVTQNTIIPDNSMAMGSPAAVKRQVMDREVENNRRNAEIYSSEGKEYAAFFREKE